ncbi:D-3-phosphoglycerate dehydrogenase [Spinactinospora alkalitolerans]|uniref:D-3-phosphoglycerate dehydrogenase n=1 Tax=Spinactinospora alkalitolerans TaxID=687207 RepID=A0A852TYR7_9ACTN|nr:hydroxyacid dehydrogenase [Spinactinospora alkalitolerans]NYE48485.1 D-3-phosphoglycerate dehydrogenase [Spinactinospora alkalitolerans]
MSADTTALVYVDDPVHPDALELLRGHGPLALGFGPEATTFDRVKDHVEGVLVRTGTVSAAMINGAPRLKVIARHGVGTDAIDVAAAGRRGIQVLITPEANAVSVAEHTIGLLIAAARRFRECDAAVRGDDFHLRDQLVGIELAGRTLGVLGLGRIGRRVAAIAGAVGMRVRAHDPFLPPDARLPPDVLAQPELRSLLDRADALTVHVPLTAQTRGLIGGGELDMLAPGAIVVNAARGGVIDEAALAERLVSGRLGGAGIDVFADEPPHGSPLLDTRNAVLTPHCAAHTGDSLRRMSVHAAEGIITVLEGGLPEGAAQPVHTA